MVTTHLAPSFPAFANAAHGEVCNIAQTYPRTSDNNLPSMDGRAAGVGHSILAWNHYGGIKVACKRHLPL